MSKEVGSDRLSLVKLIRQFNTTMKQLYTLFATLLGSIVLSITAFCQTDEPAGAPVIAVDFYSQGTFTAGSLASTTASDLPATCFAGNYDGYYQFVANTQGVKIDATTGNFDMTLEVRDAAEILVGCQNSNGAGTGETMWVTGLTPGDTYYVSVGSNGAPGAGTFDIKAEWLPNVEVRPGYTPNPATDAGLAGYKVAETTRRTWNSIFPFNINSIVTGSRYQFTAQSDGTQFTHDISGTTELLNLNSVPGPICFNETYDVMVQVQIEGQWCGYSTIQPIAMESEPTTSLNASDINGTTDLSAGISATFVSSSSILYWRLTTDNGQTVIDYDYNLQGWGNLNLPDPPCLRFNKIYTVEIAAEHCGQIGSHSQPVNIFIENVPYTKVRNVYCGTDQFIGATILCDFIASVDTYAWQWGEIVEDDPEMTPIGPAIVTYTDDATLYLLGLVSDGLQSGTAYRVGVKPLLGIDAAGNLDACDEVQEGDYGEFCQVVINPLAPPGEANGLTKEGPKIEDEKEVDLVSNGNHVDLYRIGGSNEVIQISLRKSDMSGNASLRIFDMGGKIVHQTGYGKVEQADLIQEAIPSDLPAGIYIVTLESETGILSEKVYLD